MLSDKLRFCVQGAVHLLAQFYSLSNVAGFSGVRVEESAWLEEIF